MTTWHSLHQMAGPPEHNKPLFTVLFGGKHAVFHQLWTNSTEFHQWRLSSASHVAANVVQSGQLSISDDDCVVNKFLSGIISPYFMSSPSRLATVCRLTLWSYIRCWWRYCLKAIPKMRGTQVLVLMRRGHSGSACSWFVWCVPSLPVSSWLQQHGNNRTFWRYSNTGTPNVLAIQQHGNNRTFWRYSNTGTTERSGDTAAREQPNVLAIQQHGDTERSSDTATRGHRTF